MTGTGTRKLLSLALALAACGGGTPEFYVHRTAVVVRSDAAFASQPDLPARVESTLEAALAYWGGTWDDLGGSTITLEGTDRVSCGESSDALGCHDGHEIRVSTSDPSVGPWSCVEATVLVHEVGHAVIGDPDHLDPRWMDFATVARQLDGRRGYARGGEVPCTIHLGVWRHVLAKP